MYAVILAGGGGTRLWPMSRRTHPKPFLPLLGDATLLAGTAARLSPLIEPTDIYVVTHERYVELAREQLPDVPPDHVIGEPAGRNTAAAVALAAVRIDRPDDDVMVVLPADHRIGDDEGFRRALVVAGQAAAEGAFVTLGITPSGPETGYGYVVARSGPAGGATATPVERFVEKPPVERARELLADGRASWNAGIFVWRRDRLLDGLARHAGAILGPLRAAAGGGGALATTYATLPSTSIDYALLEPASVADDVRVVPIDVGWSDLGSWAALSEALAPADASRVVQLGDALDVGSRDVLVQAQGGRLVVTVGLEGIVVVDTPDALLVCAADRAQDVKLVVDRLQETERDALL